MIAMTFSFCSDAGHGWLEVPRCELKELGIADAISSYSYQSDAQHGMIYLEEDCDALKFEIAFERRYGKRPTITPSFSESKGKRIRALDHYRA